MIDDDRVGDHEVQRAGRARGANRLAHAVADHLAAAELGLLARRREIALDPDEELRVGQAHAVARRGAVEIGVLPARQAEGHERRSHAASLASACSRRAALGQRVQAEDPAGAAELDERDALLVAGLEAHGRAGRHVEPHPERLGAVEAERAIDLEEVEVRADLDRTVARVRHRQLDGAAALIRDDVALAQQIFARNHGWPPSLNSR